MNKDDIPPSRTGTAGCEIQIQNPRRYPEAGARKLRPWIEPLVAALAPEAASLTVRLVSDREMRGLNAAYRGKDKTTDVLSFPGESEPVPGVEDQAHLGDIVVSVPTARRQAAEREQGVERELRVLLLHGVLHCLGHDHETDDGEMEALERELRARWIDDGEIDGGEAAR